MLELLEKLDLVTLLIVSAFVSVFSTAIFYYFPVFSRDGKLKSNERKNYFVMLMALLATVLQLGISIVDGTVYMWQEYLFKFLFTWSFALLFYAMMGILFVKKIFSTLKEKFKVE